MKSLSVKTGFAVFVLIAASVAQEPPPWAKRDFDAPASQVYAAALKSVQLQRHEVQTKDEQIPGCLSYVARTQPFPRTHPEYVASSLSYVCIFDGSPKIHSLPCL